MDNQHLESVRILLGQKAKLEKSEIEAVFGKVTDPVIVDRYDIFGILQHLCSGICDEEDKSKYATILSIIVQDFRNLRRDEAFPKALSEIAEAALYLYAYNKDIASEETMSEYLPSLGLLVAKEKYPWLSAILPVKAMKEIEEMAKYSLIEISSCKPEDFTRRYISFEDINVGHLDRVLMVQKLEEHLNTGEILQTVPELEDTLANYSEMAYHDLYC